MALSSSVHMGTLGLGNSGIPQVSQASQQEGPDTYPGQRVSVRSGQLLKGLDPRGWREYCATPHPAARLSASASVPTSVFSW